MSVQRLAHVALLVHGHDAAIAWVTGTREGASRGLRASGDSHG